MTPEVPEATQRTSVFDMIIENDARLKAWAEHDLRKLIDSTVAGKAVAHTSRDLAKKSLGKQNGSPFTKRITEASPPKKFSMPKFNVYSRTDPVDHVKNYQHVMAYWFTNDTVMCRMFPASLGDTTLRWFNRLPAGHIDDFRDLA